MFKMLVKNILRPALALSWAACSFAQDGSSVLREVVFKTVGAEQFGLHQFLGYPVSNYGILSAFSSGKKQNKMVERGQICSTFHCLGMTPPTEQEKLISIDERYVEIGRGAPLSFKGDQQKKRFLDLTIPVVSQIMGGSASLSSSSDANVELSAAHLVVRSIKPAEFYSRIVAFSKQNDLRPVDQQLVNLWKRGRLLVVTNDIVVDSMTLKIKLKKASGAALEAEVAAALVKGAKGKLGLNKDSDSEYTLTITEPLVLARYGRNLCEWKLEPNPCK